MKKVSVIIPCYNNEVTLEAAVASVRRQTYKNIEIILINDGSKDGTGEIVQRLSEEEGIISRHQENKGVSAARNEGMQLATGDYFIFVDGDDLIHSEFVEYLVTAIETKNADTAYCFSSRVYEKVEQAEKLKDGRDDLSKVQQEFMETLMYEKYHLVFCGFIYRAELIRQYNICFPLGVKTGEDLEFLWTYLAHCRTAIEIQRYLYWYRDNADSAVHRVSWERTNSYASIQRIRNAMKDNGCDFADTFAEYTSARYLWSYAKTFALGGRADLFSRLGKEYNMKRGMRYLVCHCPDVRVRITALLYCIHSKLFYAALSIVKDRL